jgi:hypothetical protein
MALPLSARLRTLPACPASARGVGEAAGRGFVCRASSAAAHLKLHGRHYLEHKRQDCTTHASSGRGSAWSRSRQYSWPVPGRTLRARQPTRLFPGSCVWPQLSPGAAAALAAGALAWLRPEPGGNGGGGSGAGGGGSAVRSAAVAAAARCGLAVPLLTALPGPHQPLSQVSGF